MAIQGTQVPMYTKHTLFLYFSILKKKPKTNKQKHVKQSNKTRLTQQKNKTLKLCKTKTRREREEVIESLGAL